MLRTNKWKLLITSAVILRPAVFGWIVWEKLPMQMTTHWGVDGAADGWSGRAFAVFGLPLIILLVHWICVFCTALDPKNRGQNKKVFGLVLWITPLVSLVANGMIYAVSFGKEVQPYLFTNLLLGATFIIIGNYLPKCKQNHTIGIKVKWTLENEENWNATHRMGGKVWVAGGLLLMVCVFLPDRIIPFVLVAVITVLAVVPILYSYRYYTKQVKEGTAVNTPLPKSRTHRIITGVSAVVAVMILIGAAVLMFSGEIDVVYGEESFSIEASYWSNLTVEYDAVESVEYRDQDDRGVRTNGLGSARLLAGAFRNEEFGNYTRYSYTRCDACVVLHVNGRILVMSGPDPVRTREIYEKLLTNIA